MTMPPGPLKEEQRLFALERFAVLDTTPEEEFDKTTRLVATICEAPIALVSFVDAGRQWFKSAVGLAVFETSRDSSFCAHAISYPENIFIFEDARGDPRFEYNPLVAGEPHVRFYAGAWRMRATGAISRLRDPKRAAVSAGGSANRRALSHGARRRRKERLDNPPASSSDRGYAP